MKSQVLVVDDQVSFSHHVVAILQQHRYDVSVAHDASTALEIISRQPQDILLTDMKLVGMDGLALFKSARSIDAHISGIIMTAYGSISSAVSAVKEGIADYLLKPFEPEVLVMTVEKTLRERQMLKEIHSLREEIDRKYAFGNIVGKNHKMRQIYDLIQKIATTDARVFITGETGVGKELVAKALHYNSLRKKGPFVGINCGALSETLLEAELFGYEKGAFTGAMHQKIGKLEHASEGTLFLDEIGDITPRMQVKLLRVLQEKQFERVGGNQPIDLDMRIVAATNQDIVQKVETGEFRIELFYRLNVVPIHIPALRERVEDIPLLVKHFMSLHNKNTPDSVKTLTPSAMRQLMQHSWPGNVRELENILERAFVTAENDTIDHIHLTHGMHQDVYLSPGSEVNTDIPFKIAQDIVIKRFERTYLQQALQNCHGNVTLAARETGINSRTFWRKIKRYKIDCDRFRASNGV